MEKTRDTSHVTAATASGKELLRAPFSTWTWATLFLFSLSLVGLSFFPALVLTVFILINRFINDRYDFLIMVAVLSTGVGFIAPELMPVNLSDILLAASAAGLLVYRKNPQIKKVTTAIAIYIIFLLAMSTLSDEKFSIQFQTMRWYFTIIFFILPLWVFANRRFDIKLLMKKIVVFFLIICVFYCLDGFVFSGWVLLPGTYSDAPTLSTFWDFHWMPFSTYFPRKYPSAMFIIIVAAYPLARYYKLRWWQWVIVAGAFASTRTITVIAAFVLTYVTFQGVFKQFVKYVAITAVALVSLYYIDSATGGFLRVSQAVDQFDILSESQDSDDLADFGSSRMAQIIPKYHALVEQHCLIQGFGFLHPTKTTLQRYQIDNELYSDQTRADENVAMVEVTQFNTILSTGLLGFCVEIALYLYLFFLLKKGTTEARFYLSAVMMASIMGLGGFGGLNQTMSLTFVALALGAALLDARPQWRKDSTGGSAGNDAAPATKNLPPA